MHFLTFFFLKCKIHTKFRHHLWRHNNRQITRKDGDCKVTHQTLYLPNLVKFYGFFFFLWPQTSIFWVSGRKIIANDQRVMLQYCLQYVCSQKNCHVFGIDFGNVKISQVREILHQCTRNSLRGQVQLWYCPGFFYGYLDTCFWSFSGTNVEWHFSRTYWFTRQVNSAKL